MLNKTRNRICFAVYALAAAWLVTSIGVPSARADQWPSSHLTLPSIWGNNGFTNHDNWPDFKQWFSENWPKPSPTSRPSPTPCLTTHTPPGPWQNGSCPTSSLSTDNDWSSHSPCSRPSSDPPISASVLDGPFLQLGGTAVAGSTSLGSITMIGSNGSYMPQTITVPGGDQTAAALTVNGFNPTNDEEIYGLAATTNNLATLIAELNAAVGAADPGATATAVPSNLATVLAGDNIAVFFPNNGVAAPNIFSFNLSNDTTSASITSITVVPEPLTVSTLILGAVGLVGRRKRRPQV